MQFTEFFQVASATPVIELHLAHCRKHDMPGDNELLKVPFLYIFSFTVLKIDIVIEDTRTGKSLLKPVFPKQATHRQRDSVNAGPYF